MASSFPMQHLEHVKRFYECIELELDDCPVRFCIVLPLPRAISEWRNFPKATLPLRGRVANGRGFSRGECLASGLGEAAELASSCAWGDEAIVSATAAELGPQAIAPEQLLGLTSEQYEARTTWNAEFASLDWRPKPCPADAAIAWLEVLDAYSGEVHFAPADAVLIGRREAGDDEAAAIGDSNGCASGVTLGSAKATAMLELIERDALARWWYGRRPRGRVRVPKGAGGAAIGSYLASRRRTCSVFDITTDIGIPAFAAVSAEPDGSDAVIGSSAALDAGRAVFSSLSEMLQMEVTLNTVRQTGAAPQTWGRWRETVTMDACPLSAPENEGDIEREDARHLTASESLEMCLAACRAAGVSVYFADLTRAEIGVPTVRALSTDLCHFKPRFGRRRLLAADSRDCGRTDEAIRIPNPLFLLV